MSANSAHTPTSARIVNLNLFVAFLFFKILVYNCLIMALTDKDLKSIKGVIDDSIEQNNGKIIEEVKNIVEFSIEKSEQRTDLKLESMEERIVSRINREIEDLALINREILTKIDNHEQRIGKLELKTGLASK